MHQYQPTFFVANQTSNSESVRAIEHNRRESQPMPTFNQNRLNYINCHPQFNQFTYEDKNGDKTCFQDNMIFNNRQSININNEFSISFGHYYQNRNLLKYQNDQNFIRDQFTQNNYIAFQPSSRLYSCNKFNVMSNHSRAYHQDSQNYYNQGNKLYQNYHFINDRDSLNNSMQYQQPYYLLKRDNRMDSFETKLQIPPIQQNSLFHKNFLNKLIQIYRLKDKKSFDLDHQQYFMNICFYKKTLHFELLAFLNKNYRLLSVSLKNNIEKKLCQFYPASINYQREYKKIAQINVNKVVPFKNLINEIQLFSRCFKTKQNFQWAVNKLCVCLSLFEQKIQVQFSNKKHSTQNQLVAQISQLFDIICELVTQEQEYLTQFQSQRLYLKLIEAIFMFISIFKFDKGANQFNLQSLQNVFRCVQDLLFLYNLNQVDTDQTLRLLCKQMIKQYFTLENINSNQVSDQNIEQRLFNYSLNKVLLFKNQKMPTDKIGKSILNQLLFYKQMTDLLSKSVSFQKQQIFAIKRRFMDHITTKKKIIFPK